ncbi:MAG: rhodanese-like domain-containing protein [Candidatus Lokiarchaeia archaeon]
MVEIIDGPILKKWIDAGKEMIIADARASEEYEKAHIPGAVSLLIAELETRADSVLRKGVPIVTYSEDEDCPAKKILAEKLEKMGYKPVYAYDGSYADWVKLGYPIEK